MQEQDELILSCLGRTDPGASPRPLRAKPVLLQCQPPQDHLSPALLTRADLERSVSSTWIWRHQLT